MSLPFLILSLVGLLYICNRLMQTHRQVLRDNLSIRLSVAQLEMGVRSKEYERTYQQNKAALDACKAEEDFLWERYYQRYRELHGHESFQIHFGRIDALYGDRIQFFKPKLPPRLS